VSAHDVNTVYAAFDNQQDRRLQTVSLQEHRSRKNVDVDDERSARARHDVRDRRRSRRSQLLFAGTEFGLFFSQNGGGKWIQLKADCRRSR
jgi:hypothetical protein